MYFRCVHVQLVSLSGVLYRRLCAGSPRREGLQATWPRFTTHDSRLTMVPLLAPQLVCPTLPPPPPHPERIDNISACLGPACVRACVRGAAALQAARFVMAIDLGTSSARAILFNATGAAVASSQREYGSLYPHTGWMEQSGDEIFSVVSDVRWAGLG